MVNSRPAERMFDTRAPLWPNSAMQPLNAAVDWVNSASGKAALRYFFVVLAGTAVDFGAALFAYGVLKLPLVAAAAFGYFVAVTLTYFVHEFWTFRRAESALSSVRFAKFIGASMGTLAVRLGVVWLSAPLQALPFGPVLRLGAGYACSLLVGFMVSRGVVFTNEK